METAPHLPDIWSRHSWDASVVLQSNVDAFIAQVCCVSNCFVGAEVCAMQSLSTGLACSMLDAVAVVGRLMDMLQHMVCSMG